VIFCLALIAWSYFAFVVILCIRSILPSSPVQGYVLLAVYHPIIIIFLWSYFAVVFTRPGIATEVQPPEPSQDSTTGVYTIDDEATTPLQGTTPVNTQQFTTVTVKRDGRDRFCKKCNVAKPDRAHHCRVCQECVLKMDHHCPWINGCVGFHNQKAFYLFILWGAVYCLFILSVTLPHLVYAFNEPRDAIPVDVQWVFLALASGIFGVSLVGFSIFHSWLMSRNMTTIESFQRQRYRGDTSRQLERENLFDLGSKRKNFEQVLGANVMLWFLPIKTTQGNGVAFPTNINRHGAYAMEEGRRQQL